MFDVNKCVEFSLQASNQPGFYFIDCAFSVIVIGTLVVLVWRSLWVLFDVLIFPGDPILSAYYSVVSVTILRLN